MTSFDRADHRWLGHQRVVNPPTLSRRGMISLPLHRDGRLRIHLQGRAPSASIKLWLTRRNPIERVAYISEFPGY